MLVPIPPAIVKAKAGLLRAYLAVCSHIHLIVTREL